MHDMEGPSLLPPVTSVWVPPCPYYSERRMQGT